MRFPPPPPLFGFPNKHDSCVCVAVQSEESHPIRTILTWENTDPTSPSSLCQFTKWTQPHFPLYDILPPPPTWSSRFGAQQKIVSVLFKTEGKNSVFSCIFEPDVTAVLICSLLYFVTVVQVCKTPYCV
jgi:hypothetical protein